MDNTRGKCDINEVVYQQKRKGDLINEKSMQYDVNNKFITGTVRQDIVNRE